MNRRNFIRLAGGGTVIAASAASLSACGALSGEYPPEAVEAWRGPGELGDPRKRALAYAITAPNPHNLRPGWLTCACPAASPSPPTRSACCRTPTRSAARS